MPQNNKQLNSLECFSLYALCSKGNRVKRICISPYCKGHTIYLCGMPEDKCQCHYQHKNCPSINYESFLEKLTNYKRSLSNQMNEYIQRFEKVYKNFQNKIKKELSLFKSHYESLLFGEIKSSMQKKIERKEFGKISSFEVNSFMQSLDSASTEINCGKLSLNQVRQMDNKMTQLFQRIQNLYKGKISKTFSFKKGHKQLRSYSSSSLQKFTFKDEQKSKYLRRSSIFEENDWKQNKVKYRQLQSKLALDQNLSAFLEKKKTTIILENNESLFLVKPPKINLEYPKKIPSKIIENCSNINYFIGRKIKSYQLVFRASAHNFQIKNFYHQLKKSNFSTDKQKISGGMLLIKTQFNHVLGAFTEVPILKPNLDSFIIHNLSGSESQNQHQLNPEVSKSRKKKKFLNDIKSLTFLFSLNLNEKYILTDPQKAIYVGQKSIGFGNSDLRIKNGADKIREIHCKIGDTFKLDKPYHHYNTDYDSKNLKIIGSRYGKKFKITEWEYFNVIYEYSA